MISILHIVVSVANNIIIIITMMLMMMIRERAERRNEGMNEAFGAVQELQQAVR